MNAEETGKAIRAFRAEFCPFCGVSKKLNDSFCGECFHQLPIKIQTLLNEKSGFFEGFHPAMDHLRDNPRNTPPIS